MHKKVVYAWCAVTAWFVWDRASILLLAWYSAVDPPLTTAWILRSCAQITVATAVAAVAVYTLAPEEAQQFSGAHRLDAESTE
jgi:hypothetical protein